MSAGDFRLSFSVLISSPGLLVNWRERKIRVPRDFTLRRGSGCRTQTFIVSDVNDAN